MIKNEEEYTYLSHLKDQGLDTDLDLFIRRMTRAPFDYDQKDADSVLQSLNQIISPLSQTINLRTSKADFR